MLTETEYIEFRRELEAASRHLNNLLENAAARRSREARPPQPPGWRCSSACDGKMVTIVSDLTRCSKCGREMRGVDRVAIPVGAVAGTDAVQWTSEENIQIAQARANIEEIELRMLNARV